MHSKCFPSAELALDRWPWVSNNQSVEALMSSGLEWPKITIVTPSYNQGEYIEETIRSVLLQSYPNLEYIIMDGGSSDQTVEIIKKYESWISFWVSEPDRGQTHAINKGFQRASGEILAWINSDDFYEPDIFRLVAERFIEAGESFLLYGDCKEVNEHSDLKRTYSSPFEGLESLISQKGFIPQPASFFSKKILDEIGLLDESLDYAMDCDLWIRIANHYPIVHVREVYADFRIHSESKTGAYLPLMLDEHTSVVKRYWGKKSELVYHKRCIAARRQRSAVFLQFAERTDSGSKVEILTFLFRAISVYPLVVFKRAFLSIVLKKIIGIALNNGC